MAAVLAAVVIIWWLLRLRSHHSPAPFAFEAPTLLHRQDFPQPDAKWLLVVFTARKCNSCRSVLAEVQDLVSDLSALGSSVAFAESQSPQDTKLHERYGIEAVPITVLCDLTGEVKACHLGLLPADFKQALLELISG